MHIKERCQGKEVLEFDNDGNIGVCKTMAIAVRVTEQADVQRETSSQSIVAAISSRVKGFKGRKDEKNIPDREGSFGGYGVRK